MADTKRVKSVYSRTAGYPKYCRIYGVMSGNAGYLVLMAGDIRKTAMHVGSGSRVAGWPVAGLDHVTLGWGATPTSSGAART